MMFRADRMMARRTFAGMSRSVLADRAGVTREAVRLIELGRVSPRPETVVAIADALGVELSELWTEIPA